MSLTIQEFNRLPRQERERRYCELSSHDKFLARVGEWGFSAGEPMMTLEELLEDTETLEFITMERLERLFPEEIQKWKKDNNN